MRTKIIAVIAAIGLGLGIGAAVAASGGPAQTGATHYYDGTHG